MDKEANFSDEIEQVVKTYFESRTGWSATKLDKKNIGQNPDYRVCYPGGYFLCEVKTVSSVYASYSGRPVDYHLEQRQKQRLCIDQWREKNPATPLIMSETERDFLFSDDEDFIKKYDQRRRNTQAEFDSFADTMRKYFSSSIISDLPYHLRLDSQNLYAPTKDERGKFFDWLEKEILAIHEGNPSRRWAIDPYPGLATYSTSYQIHTPQHEGDTESIYSLILSRLLAPAKFQLDPHSYGVLNLRAITQNIEKAATQLKTRALTDNDPSLPRIIILAFGSGLRFELDLLCQHVWEELEQHKDISSIAVLQWRPGPAYPFDEPVPFFIAFHNMYLRNDIKPLLGFVFDDEWSTQLDSPQTIM